jgi:hypothetical protein
MKKDEVQVGKTYTVKVSGKLVPVALVQENPLGGWNGVNLVTHRGVRIHSAARLRRRLDRPAIGVGTRVAISIDQGLQKAEGIVRAVETDDTGTIYRVDVTSGDPCNEHRTADGELWVCAFEVKPLPA